MGRFSSEFIEVRQRALERFLIRVANNSEMGSCSAFVLFIEADETTLANAMNETKLLKPKVTATAYKMFEGTLNAIQNNGKVRNTTIIDYLNHL